MFFELVDDVLERLIRHDANRDGGRRRARDERLLSGSDDLDPVHREGRLTPPEGKQDPVSDVKTRESKQSGGLTV